MQNTKSNTTQTNSNLLNDFHLAINHLPILLRNKICEECGWSIPTYYRKCRSKTGTKKTCSKAEEQMIMSVYLKTLQEAFDQFDKHKSVLSMAV